MTLLALFILFGRYINSILSDVMVCSSCNSYVKLNEGQKTILDDNYHRRMICHKCLGKNNDKTYYKLLAVAIVIDIIVYLLLK